MARGSPRVRWNPTTRRRPPGRDQPTSSTCSPPGRLAKAPATPTSRCPAPTARPPCAPPASTSPTTRPSARRSPSGATPKHRSSPSAVPAWDNRSDGTLGYNPTLNVVVTDGNPASATNHQSGVNIVAVTVDGRRVYYYDNPSTDCTDCSLNQAITLPITTAGDHTVQATSIDLAGNASQTDVIHLNVTTIASPPGYDYDLGDPTAAVQQTDDIAFDPSPTTAFCNVDTDTGEDCASPDEADPGPDPADASVSRASVAGDPLAPGGSGWGLSVRRPEGLLDADAVHLRAQRARIVVPWDVASRPTANVRDDCGPAGDAGANYANLINWIKAAKQNHQQMLVSFGRCSGGDRGVEYRNLPSIAQYRAAVTAFLNDRNLTDIHDFTAWNEPNRDGQPTGYSKLPWRTNGETGPHAAARFWSTLHKLCESKHCSVAAGDFVDGNDFTNRYLKAYKAALDTQPTVWSVHPYLAANAPDPNHYESFLRETRRTDGKKSPAIWITEVGAVLNSLSFPNRTAAQMEAAMQRILSSTIVDRTSRISRLYYYSIFGDPLPSFDSGLEGLSNGKVIRPEYGDYLAKTNPHNTGP